MLCRGARIECLPSPHVRGLRVPDHPPDGLTFGVVGAIPRPVDIWIDEGRLPAHMRAVPKG